MSADFDVVFISYSEANADENYAQLLSVFGNAKRVHGVVGIEQAFIQAAKVCESEHFFSVDGDSWVYEHFSFTQHFRQVGLGEVVAFRSRNPVNDLAYGFGAIKLWNKKTVLEYQPAGRDEFTMNAATNGYHVSETIASETRFNIDPEDTFVAAYRECCKLFEGYETGRRERRPQAEISQGVARLRAWVSIGEERKNGKWSLLGARQAVLDSLSNNRLTGNLRKHQIVVARMTSYLEETETKIQKSEQAIRKMAPFLFDETSTTS